MSNDLPWYEDWFTCAQDELEKQADGSYRYLSRWYNLRDGRHDDMDANFKCSAWEAGKCAIEFLPGDYSLGAMLMVDTDYESYEIKYSSASFAGIDYMEAIWVSARQPLQEGTPEYDAWYDVVTQKMAQYIPNTPMTDLGYIRHTDDCVYTLG